MMSCLSGNCWDNGQIEKVRSYGMKLRICKNYSPYDCSHCFDQLHGLRDDSVVEVRDVTEYSYIYEVHPLWK